jgi:hypothetical protein
VGLSDSLLGTPCRLFGRLTRLINARLNFCRHLLEPIGDILARLLALLLDLLGLGSLSRAWRMRS